MLKDNDGTRINGYKVAMNKLRLEIRRRLLIIREVMFWNRFPIGVVGGKQHN